MSPIETTLFAYRALASDVDALSSEIKHLVHSDLDYSRNTQKAKDGKTPDKIKIVMGTAADVASFTMWRTIMGDALLLDGRALGLLNLQSDDITKYTPPQPLPAASLKITVSQSPEGSIAQGAAVTYLALVENDKAAGPTVGAVTVSWSASSGITVQKIPADASWTCDANNTSCTQSNVLQPEKSYSAIPIPVKIAQDASSPQTITARVSGGGSASSTGPVTTNILFSTITKITPNPQVPAGGGSVTVTGNETSQYGGTPDGAVTVSDGGSSTTVQLQNGGFTAQLTVPAGRSTITAQYAGTARFAPSNDSYQVVPAGGGRGGPPPPPPAPAANAQPPAPVGGGTAAAPSTSGTFGTVLGAIPTIATLLQEAFSVTQTLAPSQTTMTDAPLINMVAGRLRADRVPVYIPSTYPPHLLRNGNLYDTYIWRALSQLEKHRVELWAATADWNKNLSAANFVVANSAKYKPEDVNLALQYVGKAQSLIATAQAVGNSIDSFEITLFGGQATTQSPSQNSQTQTQSPTPGSNQTGTPASNQTGSPASPATGTNPNANPNANANPSPSPTANPNQGQQPTGQNQSAQQVTALLPQILASDLLAHALWSDDYFWTLLTDSSWLANSLEDLTQAGRFADFAKDASKVQAYASQVRQFADVTKGVRFLNVHALEAGGSQLNKSNFFYGTHIFFSGGAVMTFSLYDVDGVTQCSGLAYNYEGNVREKRYDRSLRAPTLPAILSSEYPCRLDPEHPYIPNLSNVHKGTTVSELIEQVGPPNRLVEINGDSATYEYDAIDDAKIRIDAKKIAADAKKVADDATKVAKIAKKTASQASATSSDATQTETDANTVVTDAGGTAANAKKTASDAKRTATAASETAADAEKAGADLTKAAGDVGKIAAAAHANSRNATQTETAANTVVTDARAAATNARKTSQDAKKTEVDARKAESHANRIASEASQTATDADQTFKDAEAPILSKTRVTIQHGLVVKKWIVKQDKRQNKKK